MNVVIEMKEEFNIFKNQGNVIEFADINKKIYESLEWLEKVVREMFSINDSDNVRIEKCEENDFNIYVNDKCLCNLVFYTNNNNDDYSAMIIDSSYVIHKLLLRETSTYIMGKLISYSFKIDGKNYFVSKKVGNKVEISIEQDMKNGQKKGIHIYTSSFECNKEYLMSVLSSINLEDSVPEVYSCLKEKLGISIQTSKKLFIKKFTVSKNIGTTINEYIEIRDGNLESYELISRVGNVPIKIKKLYGSKSIVMNSDEPTITLFKAVFESNDLIQFIQNLEEKPKGKTKKL